MKPLAPPYAIEDHWLGADACEALLAWTLANESSFVPAVLEGGEVDRAVRVGASLRDLGPFETTLRSRLIAAHTHFTDTLRVTPFTLAEVELELVAHGDGAHFVPHQDTYSGTSHSRRGERILSAVYYFHREPRAFAGGALRLHAFGSDPGDPAVDLSPERDRLVVFPSWACHEVRPVTVPGRAFADSRFAINCWFYRPSTRITAQA